MEVRPREEARHLLVVPLSTGARARCSLSAAWPSKLLGSLGCQALWPAAVWPAAAQAFAPATVLRTGSNPMPPAPTYLAM